jgi:hypothetical protein
MVKSMEAKTKLAQLKLLEEKAKIRSGLPYLHAFKNYEWQKEFLESTNKKCFLTAANQIGKSTIQIRKMIHWATETSLWPMLWTTQPRLFFYLYPSKDLATLEYATKWAPLLPQGEFKNHPKYGWKANFDNKNIKEIVFNSGVVLAFRTYAMDVQNLQAGTVYYIGCDEELPAELWDELKVRLAATNGYFSLVFTATLGQEFWRETMEEQGTDLERFTGADKWQISLYDCMTYVDGTPSHWTKERIEEVIADCSTENEVLRRVFGRFVLTEGRKYASFSIKENCRPGGEVPKGWPLYAGIDHGSGGPKGHPAAICFIAVKPDYTRGRIVRAWRGDGISTEATQIVQQYQKMKLELQGFGNKLITSYYDWGSKELFLVASRLGETFVKAEKGHEVGETTFNSLFKNQMLFLDSEHTEVMKLASELSSLRTDAVKTKAKDDLADAMRYAGVSIPWNWTIIRGRPDTYKEPEKPQTELDRRRNGLNYPEPTPEELLDAEFAEINSFYGE